MGRALCLVLASLFVPFPGTAAAQDGDRLFDQGIEAYRAGRLAVAAELLKAADEAGRQGLALVYNLGVVLYRLGRYGEAETAFRRLLDTPEMHALATYNLGLTAKADGRADDARAWFEKALTAADTDTLRRLARRQLEPETGSPPSPRWHAFAGLHAGWDDNVVDPSDTTGAEEADGYLEALANATVQVTGTPDRGTRLGFSAYAVDYASVDAFDLSLARLTAADIRSGRELALEAEQGSLGGKDYLRSLGFRMGLEADRLAPGQPRIAYRYRRIEPLAPEFDPQEGHQHVLRLERPWRRDDRRVEATYQLERDDRSDLSKNGLFTSYSAWRQGLAAAAGWTAGRYRMDLDMGLRYSRYDDADTLPEGGSRVRTDRLWRAAVQLSRPVARRWEVRVRLERISNDSNIDAYTYGRNLFSIGLTGLF